MQKHVKLVAILNIVYRSMMLVGGCILLLLADLFGRLVIFLERRGDLHVEDVPAEILDLVPVLFVIIGTAMIVFSIVAIVGSIGLLKTKEWGRITVIAISFLNLFHMPLGTVLGVYSLWVLFNDEIVRLFNPSRPENIPQSTTTS